MAPAGNGRTEEWKEGNESVNVLSLECCESDLSMASREEVENWACSAIAFR